MTCAAIAPTPALAESTWVPADSGPCGICRFIYPVLTTQAWLCAALSLLAQHLVRSLEGPGDSEGWEAFGK